MLTYSRTTHESSDFWLLSAIYHGGRLAIPASRLRAAFRHVNSTSMGWGICTYESLVEHGLWRTWSSCIVFFSSCVIIGVSVRVIIGVRATFPFLSCIVDRLCIPLGPRPICLVEGASSRGQRTPIGLLRLSSDPSNVCPIDCRCTS